MNMTRPSTFDIFNIHICIIYEETATSAFPFHLSTFPLIFVHCTRNLQFSTPKNESIPSFVDRNIHSVIRNDEDTLVNYLWKINKTKERTINFSELDFSYTNWSRSINSVLTIIETHKVVYFTSLPFSYCKIFETISDGFYQRERRRRMLEPRKKC